MTMVMPSHPNTVATGPNEEHLDVLVIGGSQAGLAAGYHLARHGLRFVILDAHERVGDAWRARWDSLRLFTPAKVTSLPGMPFPGPPNAFPSKDDVAAYLETYAATMHLPVRTGVEARHATRPGDRWWVETSNGSLTADALIVATGGYQNPNIPAWATELDPAIRQLHSTAYRHPSQFQPGTVLVVGASHSGADIALEAVREHHTILAGRDTGQVPVPTDGKLAPFLAPLIWFALSHVVTINTPIGRKAMENFRTHGFPLEHPTRADIAAAGVERVTARVSGVEGGQPVLVDGRVLDVHNVIWCTGFRGNYAWIDGASVDEDGYPEHHRGIANGVEGLYYVGLRFQYSGVSSLVGGVGRDAAYVVDRIARRVAAA